MKPYCVKCPQAIMVVLLSAVVLYAAIRFSVTVGIVLAVIVLGLCTAASFDSGESSSCPGHVPSWLH